MNRIAFTSVFFVIFVDAIGVSMFAPLLSYALFHPPIVLMPEYSVAARNVFYGIALGLYAVFMFVGAPILGKLSDRIGRRPVILACLVGLMLSYLIAGLSVTVGSMALMIISRIVGGITAASQAVAQSAALDATKVESKNFIISMCLLASSLGFVFGPLIGGFLSNAKWVSWFGPMVPFYAGCLFSFLIAVSIYFSFHTNKSPREEKKKLQFKDLLPNFHGALTRTNLRWLMLVFCLMQMGWASYFLFLPTFLFWKFHFTEIQVSSYMAMLGVGFVFAYGLVIPIMLKWFHNHLLLKFGMVLSTCLILLNILLPNGISLWIVAFLLSITICIAYASAINLFIQSVLHSEQGWVLGIALAVISFAWGVIPMVSGGINGTYYYASMIMAVALLFASSICLFLRKWRSDG